MGDAIDRMDIEREIRHLKELMAERDKALSLQHGEYERRLSMLNGEADRLRSMQATYVLREVFDNKVKENQGGVDAVAREVSARTDGLEEQLRASFKDRAELHAELGLLKAKVAGLSESLTWLMRLFVTALVSGVIALGFTFFRR